MKEHRELRSTVLQANTLLHESGLVTLTWGNVSGIDRSAGVVAIKPSGVPYDELSVEQVVLVDLDGRVVSGDLKPSSDTHTHLVLYREFPQLGGVAHSHSANAVMFAQACKEIPCLGTTHADVFHGPVPVTRPLSLEEVQDEYERNTGVVIAERFADLDPASVPGVLVAQHGPFAWGCHATAAAENAVALEAIARMAMGTLILRPDTPPIEKHLLDKHYRRKHGPDAYYGQEVC